MATLLNGNTSRHHCNRVVGVQLTERITNSSLWSIWRRVSLNLPICSETQRGFDGTVCYRFPTSQWFRNTLKIVNNAFRILSGRNLIKEFAQPLAHSFIENTGREWEREEQDFIFSHFYSVFNTISLYYRTVTKDYFCNQVIGWLYWWLIEWLYNYTFLVFEKHLKWHKIHK